MFSRSATLANSAGKCAASHHSSAPCVIARAFTFGAYGHGRRNCCAVRGITLCDAAQYVIKETRVKRTQNALRCDIDCQLRCGSAPTPVQQCLSRTNLRTRRCIVVIHHPYQCCNGAAIFGRAIRLSAFPIRQMPRYAQTASRFNAVMQVVLLVSSLWVGVPPPACSGQECRQGSVFRPRCG